MFVRKVWFVCFASGILWSSVPAWAGAMAQPDQQASAQQAADDPEDIQESEASEKRSTANAQSSAAPSDGDVASTASASSQDCKKPKTITIGVEDGVALGGPLPTTRAEQVLKQAFPERCYQLVYRALRRDDVAPSVVTGRVMLGWVAVPPPQQLSTGRYESPVLEERKFGGVDTLPVMPPSYSVVAELESTVSKRSLSKWEFPMVGLLSGVVGIFALGGCLLLINWKFPRLDRLPERSITRVDPYLTQSGKPWGWVLRTASGRLFGLMWAAMGLGAFMIVGQAETEESFGPTQHSYFEGALRAAYPGRTIQEYNGTRWRECDEPNECLYNLSLKNTYAVAGDRELLCYYAKATGVENIKFDPNASAVPMMQMFLLPPKTAVRDAQTIRTRLLDAMRTQTGELSPWHRCNGSDTGVSQ